jgi:hypothetical protein
MLHLAHDDQPGARACLDKAWQLVNGRSEPHFVRLQRELTERRKGLDLA